MSKLYRFGVSLEQTLIDEFDRQIKASNYQNRSEAIRDLIRESLAKKKQAEGGRAAGAIVMTYDHHKRSLVNKLLDVQHDYQGLIISTQHVHMDHVHCMEIIAVHGKTTVIEKLADAIRAHIGVKHVALSLTSAEL